MSAFQDNSEEQRLTASNINIKTREMERFPLSLNVSVMGLTFLSSIFFLSLKPTNPFAQFPIQVGIANMSHMPKT